MLIRANRRRFWQFVGVGFDEYFDGFVAGVNFNTQRAALEIDFVTPSRFTANNCVGHLRSYERLKGWEGVKAPPTVDRWSACPSRFTGFSSQSSRDALAVLVAALIELGSGLGLWVATAGTKATRPTPAPEAWLCPPESHRSSQR